MWLGKLRHGGKDAAHPHSQSGEEYGGMSLFSSISARLIHPMVDLVNRQI